MTFSCIVKSRCGIQSLPCCVVICILKKYGQLVQIRWQSVESGLPLLNAPLPPDDRYEKYLAVVTWKSACLTLSMSLSSPVTSARLNAALNQAFLVSSVMFEGLSHSWNSWDCGKQVAFQPFLVGCQLFVPVSQQNLINVIHLEFNVAKFNIYFTNCTFRTPLVSWILEGKVKSVILWNNPELVGEAVDNLRSSWETSVS